MTKNLVHTSKPSKPTFGFEDKRLHAFLHEYELINLDKFGISTKPIPSFVPALLAWIFFLVFPLILLIDWKSRPVEIVGDDIVRLYLPIFFAAIIFGMNQRFLIVKLFFMRKIKAYIGANLLLIIFIIGLRELILNVLLQSPNGSLYSIYIKGEAGYRLGNIILSIVAFLLFTLIICLLNISFRVSANHTRFAYWVRQKQNEILQSDLAFLKMQLSPHFLFNTLNNIAALMDIDVKKAQNGILQISSLLRTILYETKDDMISLKSEVMILEKYMELEKLRFGSNVDCRMEISLENDQIEIVPLLLMPLVENAVKHGVHPIHPSKIFICIEEKNRHLLCRVENSMFPRKNSPGNVGGIGLSNMQKRLDCFYPDRYKYNITHEGEMYLASLEIDLS
jgi:two-component system, LytTR family, sensor histidine kinase AlgZ